MLHRSFVASDNRDAAGARGLATRAARAAGARPALRRGPAAGGGHGRRAGHRRSRRRARRRAQPALGGRARRADAEREPRHGHRRERGEPRGARRAHRGRRDRAARLRLHLGRDRHRRRDRDRRRPLPRRARLRRRDRAPHDRRLRAAVSVRLARLPRAARRPGRDPAPRRLGLARALPGLATGVAGRDARRVRARGAREDARGAQPGGPHAGDRRGGGRQPAESRGAAVGRLLRAADGVAARADRERAPQSPARRRRLGLRRAWRRGSEARRPFAARWRCRAARRSTIRRRSAPARYPSSAERVPRRSAGILLYRLAGDAPEVLLVHPGGPFWARKDAGVWSIPKGEYDDDRGPARVRAARVRGGDRHGARPRGAARPRQRRRSAAASS